jgi:hypothetical protein
MLGSDDLISPKLFRAYKKYLKDYDYIYLTDCSFFDTKTKQGLYWGGYLEDHNREDAAGIGRMLSANLMEQLDWSPWAAGYDQVLDTGMDVKLKQCNFKRIALRSKDEGLALDIKSATNMTPFEVWPNTEKVHGRKVLSELPEALIERIYNCNESQG